MSLDALSLVGFMDQQSALAYLLNVCMCPNNDPAVLIQEWQTARSQLGSSMSNAGQPQVSTLQHPYLQQVVANPHFANVVGAQPWEFALVEVDALLAYQFHVLLGQAQKHCASVPNNPSVDDMLPVCLPSVYPPPSFTTYVNPGHGALVEAPDLDLAVIGEGRIVPDPSVQVFIAGLVYGQPSPWIIVREFLGRHYLANGFHRAYGLRQRGAREIPCILLHVSDFAQIGARGGGATFDQTILTSVDPPTCGHFANGRAYALRVRHLRRFLSVSWTEYVVREE